MISTQVTSKDKKLLDLAGCSVVRGTDRGDGVFGGAFAFGAKKLAMERIPAAGCFGGAMSLACSGKKTERAAPADASRRA